MTQFSPDLYKNKHDGAGHDAHALATLNKLKAKVDLSGELFKGNEIAALENYKKLFPNEWAIHENQEAFRELTPAEQQEVFNNYIDNNMMRVANRE